jgi:hypothetical protein
MSNYTPENWVIIKFKGDDPHYRVLGGWSDISLTHDYWRMNSGIVRHEFDVDYWYFYGSSGSCYKCYKDNYRLHNNIAHVWDKLQEVHGDKVKIVEDQAWIKKDWDWIIK